MAGQPQIIDQFINYLRFERHFSQYTARCYGADLRQYAEYLESKNQPAQNQQPQAPQATQTARTA